MAAERTGRSLPDASALVQNIKRLAEAARRHDYPVVWVRAEALQNDSPVWTHRSRRSTGTNAEPRVICEAGSWGAEFFELTPLSGEKVITKHRYSGFLGTDLDAYLSGVGVTGVVVCGVATEICVESTARDAFQRNYVTITAKDASQSRNPQAHDNTMGVLSRICGPVLNVAEIVELWEGR